MPFIDRYQEKSLGELLLQNGLIRKEQLQRALEEQQRSAEPLGKTLVRLGYVREEDVLRALQGLLVVTFHLADEEYAFEALFVREIIRWQEINRLPHMPPYIEGLLHHRDMVIPVVNLAARLGHTAQPPNEESRIIIVEYSSQIFGLVVDSVEAVVQLPLDRIEGNPGGLHGVANRYIYGVGKYNQKLITLLHLEGVLKEIAMPDHFPETGPVE